MSTYCAKCHEFVSGYTSRRIDDKPAIVCSGCALFMDEIAALKKELEEQARIVGMGAERELKLMTDVQTLKAELYDKSEKIRKLEAAYKEMDRALFDIGSRAKHYMTPMEQDMKRVAVEAIAMVQALLAASDETGCGCKVAGPGNVTITCPHGNLISSDEGKE